MREFQERLDVERHIWEENYKKEKVRDLQHSLFQQGGFTLDPLL